MNHDHRRHPTKPTGQEERQPDGDQSKQGAENLQLRLRKVHLKNFRIHADYVFEPDETGVTAIIGRNGHGKSTIIDGIAWALYGAKPNSGIKNSSWRKIDAPDNENSYVEVTFDMNGQELKVKRTLIGPKASSVTCECWIDGVLEAGPAVSHASRWIVSVLQLDEEGFLSTMLVQQKHVGELVSASRAERRRILERLTGITAVSAALEKAKEEEKLTKRSAASTEVDESRIPVLQKTIKKQDAQQDKVSGAIFKTQDQLSKLSEEGKAAKSKLDKAEAALDHRRELESSLAVIRSSLESKQAQQADLLERHDELKKTLPTVKMSPAELEDIRRDLQSAKTRLSDLRRRESALQAQLDSAPTDEALDDARATMEDLKNQLASGKSAKDLHGELDKVRASKAEDDAKINQARRSLGEIKDGVAKCPTCLQDIDDPQHLKDKFSKIIEDAEAHRKTLKDKYDLLSNKLDEVTELESKLTMARDEITRLEDAKRAVVDVPEELVRVRGEIRSTETMMESNQGLVNRYEADKAKYDEYDRVRSQLKSIVPEISSLERGSKSIGDELAGIKVDESRMARLREDLDAKRDRRNDLRVKLSDLQGELKLAESEAASARRELESVEEQVKRHKASLESLEVAATASSLLGKFREHVILSSVPRVTDYASELIESISDGAFTAIMIDRSFNITVESGDGIVKSVSQLSGGEEDLVAICLRLGISLMLSDGAPSMLILDEVLTAMDSERAEAILETMQDLADGQIIIVAHNEIVKSIADKVVEL